MMAASERWAPAPGFEGTYEVSTDGRVRSLDRTIVHRDGRPHRYRGRILRPALGPRGYLTVHLHGPAWRGSRTVHRLVAEAFLGPRPEGFQINHRNGSKIDNRLANLEWVSPKANSQHALNTGLSPRGEASPHAKLTTASVRQIRALAGRVPNMTLARRFGVSPKQIRNVINRVCWKHVREEGTRQ